MTRLLVFSVLLLLVVACYVTNAQFNPNYVDNRKVMVHLMEWKFSDVAAECESWLGPRGFAGVQLSPVQECVILPGRPWYERYQPMSYKLISRSGNEADFLNMATRCNRVGVRIYVDVLPNHMAAAQPGGNIGTAGSTADPANRQFPAVPYGPNDFNQPRCDIKDWNNADQIRKCNLLGLEDLNQGYDWTRDRIVEHLNHLIDLGAAGFRIDAAKHMYPDHLSAIYGRLKNLNPTFGFPSGARPFIFQEVIDYGNDAISRFEYTPMGAVTEFSFSQKIGDAFRGNTQLKYLQNFGEEWGFVPSAESLVFVDNHDNQRDAGVVLTYKDPRPYKMAIAFACANNYGNLRIMSSFAFSTHEDGPPADANGNILSPTFNPDGSCAAGWICEHRWRQIANMAEFRNIIEGEHKVNWWDNDFNQIAFSRGVKGFVAVNGQSDNLNQSLQTGLPAGTYCDIISGENVNGACTGASVRVGADGMAQISIAGNAPDGVLAIHIGARSKLS